MPLWNWIKRNPPLPPVAAGLAPDRQLPAIDTFRERYENRTLDRDEAYSLIIDLARTIRPVQFALQKSGAGYNIALPAEKLVELFLVAWKMGNEAPRE